MKMSNENAGSTKDTKQVKRGYELDSRVIAVIQEEYADFAKYLPTPQDRAMFSRKVKEYWEKITARLKEMEI